MATTTPALASEAYKNQIRDIASGATTPVSGFKTFGSSDKHIVFQESLTVDAGAMTELGTGITYSSAGALCGTTGSLNIPVAADQAALLAIEGCFTVYIDQQAGIKDAGTIPKYVPAGNEYLFVLGATSPTLGFYQDAASTPKWLNGTSSDPATIRTNTTGKETHNRWDFSWKNNVCTAYVNYWPIAQTSYTFLATDFTSGISFGFNGANALSGASYKNAVLSDRAIDLTQNVDLSSIAGFGHSFDEGMSVANAGGLLIDPNGQHTRYDTSSYSTFQRHVSATNKTVNKTGDGFIKGFGVGGSAISGVAAQITTALAYDAAQYANMTAAVVTTGINDLTTADIVAADKVSLQGIVDDLRDAGCKKMFFLNCTHPSADAASYPPSSTFDNRVNLLNSYFDEIANENAGVYIVDLWTYTGGNTPTASMFGTGAGDNIHPSAQTYHDIGDLIYNAYVASLVNDENHQAVTSAMALNTEADYISLSVAAGTYAVTLGVPEESQIGQEKIIEMIDATGTSVTMALTNVTGGTAATTATWNAVDESLVLRAGVNKWIVVAEAGVTLS